MVEYSGHFLVVFDQEMLSTFCPVIPMFLELSSAEPYLNYQWGTPA
jgi:hypothetical protein